MTNKSHIPSSKSHIARRPKPWRLGFGIWALGFLLSSCAARGVSFPADPGQPFTEYATVHTELARACSGVRTLTAELSLAGRAGAERLRGRVVAGFERPASMRLEGVAPFGPPAFILAARGDTATLLLPRDNAVLRNARADQILGALTGVNLAAADLQAILTGCVEATPQANSGRRHAGGWASLALAGGSTLFLQMRNGAWQVRGARRAGWEIDYPAWQGSFPQTVRLRSTSAGALVDLTATLAQLEANVDVDDAAFDVNVPASAGAITLDELRESGPLRGQ